MDEQVKNHISYDSVNLELKKSDILLEIDRMSILKKEIIGIYAKVKQIDEKRHKDLADHKHSNDIYNQDNLDEIIQKKGNFNFIEMIKKKFEEVNNIYDNIKLEFYNHFSTIEKNKNIGSEDLRKKIDDSYSRILSLKIKINLIWGLTDREKLKNIYKEVDIELKKVNDLRNEIQAFIAKNRQDNIIPETPRVQDEISHETFIFAWGFSLIYYIVLIVLIIVGINFIMRKK